MHVSEMKR